MEPDLGLAEAGKAGRRNEPWQLRLTRPLLRGMSEEGNRFGAIWRKAAVQNEDSCARELLRADPFRVENLRKPAAAFFILRMFC